MKDLKIRVADEAESKEAQELFFKLGAKWRSQINREEAAYVINTEYPSIILHGGDMSLNWNTIEEFNSLCYYKEITLQELRDMVNQDQDEPFLTPETTLNNQYAEIERVRQKTDSLPEFKHDFVNHPKHYCDHPSGIECIEITRHHDFAIGNAIRTS